MDFREIVDYLDKCMDPSTSDLPDYANAVQCRAFPALQGNEFYGQLYDRQELQRWWSSPQHANVDYLNNPLNPDQKAMTPAGRGMFVGLMAATEEALAYSELAGLNPILHCIRLLEFLRFLKSQQFDYLDQLDERGKKAESQGLRAQLDDLATVIPVLGAELNRFVVDIDRLTHAIGAYVDRFFQENDAQFSSVFQADWISIKQLIDWLRRPENALHAIQGRMDLREITLGANELPAIPERNIEAMDNLHVRWLHKFHISHREFREQIYPEQRWIMPILERPRVEGPAILPPQGVEGGIQQVQEVDQRLQQQLELQRQQEQQEQERVRQLELQRQQEQQEQERVRQLELQRQQEQQEQERVRQLELQRQQEQQEQERVRQLELQRQQEQQEQERERLDQLRRQVEQGRIRLDQQRQQVEQERAQLEQQRQRIEQENAELERQEKQRQQEKLRQQEETARLAKAKAEQEERQRQEVAAKLAKAKVEQEEKLRQEAAAKLAKEKAEQEKKRQQEAAVKLAKEKAEQEKKRQQEAAARIATERANAEKLKATQKVPVVTSANHACAQQSRQQPTAAEVLAAGFKLGM